MLSCCVKLTKKRICVISLSAAVFALLLTVFLIGAKSDKRERVDISNGQTLVDYLKSYGWNVEPQPLEKELIYIPSEFNDVYSDYNELQKKQGFDLTRHKGEEVYRYTFRIDDCNSDENVRINLLVQKNGTVIGGDVCSVELNGFMKEFK